jgi:transcriptional regulator with GAF, ATPase, and Fis domain
MVVLYSTAINDVLSSMDIIQTAYIAPYGLVTFMLIQSITINKKSAKAISSNEELSTQLTLEKENLELKIDERTRELQFQHDKLISHQEKEKLQNWVNEGVAKLNDVLSKNKDDYKQLCSNVLSALLKYIDAKMGALYVLNSESKENPYLEMVADYGLSKEVKNQNAVIPTNTGLIGASFKENEVQLITNMPDDYLKINSGLGNSQPGSILIVPLTFDETVFGVIELAGFKVFSSHEVDFVKNIAYSVANNLNTVKMNERNLKLIQQFKEHSNNMKENEERLQRNLEELEFIREQYELLKKSKVIDN